jgi:hypothetical protein
VSTWLKDLLGLTLAALIAGLVVIRVRRSSRKKRQPDKTNYDLTVDELHQLLVSGKITQEEFDRLKTIVLSRRSVNVGKTGGFEVIQKPPPD